MDDWQKRYYRKVLDFVKAPDDVDLETVQVESSFSFGYSYSTYTSESAEFTITAYWQEPDGRHYLTLHEDEAIDLLRSFG